LDLMFGTLKLSYAVRNSSICIKHHTKDGMRRIMLDRLFTTSEKTTTLAVASNETTAFRRITLDLHNGHLVGAFLFPAVFNINKRLAKIAKVFIFFVTDLSSGTVHILPAYCNPILLAGFRLPCLPSFDSEGQKQE